MQTGKGKQWSNMGILDLLCGHQMNPTSTTTFQTVRDNYPTAGEQYSYQPVQTSVYQNVIPGSMGTTQYATGTSVPAYHYTGGQVYQHGTAASSTYIPMAVNSFNSGKNVDLMTSAGTYYGATSAGGKRPTPENIEVESRIQYIPFQYSETVYDDQVVSTTIPIEREVVEYEEVQRTVRTPVERTIIDHFAVETQIEYIPREIEETVIEYEQQEEFVERIQYVPIETQIVHYPEFLQAQGGQISKSKVSGGYVTQAGGSAYGSGQGFTTNTTKTYTVPQQVSGSTNVVYSGQAGNIYAGNQGYAVGSGSQAVSGGQIAYTTTTGGNYGNYVPVSSSNQVYTTGSTQVISGGQGSQVYHTGTGGSNYFGGNTITTGQKIYTTGTTGGYTTGATGGYTTGATGGYTTGTTGGYTTGTTGGYTNGATGGYTTSTAGGAYTTGTTGGVYTTTGSGVRGKGIETVTYTTN